MAQGYKTGGRAKGTPNRPKPYRQECTDQLAKFVCGKLSPQQLGKWFTALTERDKLNFLLRALEYIIPKQKAQDFTLHSENDTSHDFISQLARMAVEGSDPESAKISNNS